MKNNFDVIIVGGGPVGAALGIELGLNGIHTLILEKHHVPLLSPRAMSLNVRTMELMHRWGVADALKSKRLLPDEFSQGGVWCSALNGNTYAKVDSNNLISDAESSERSLRIPLWITEETLRNRLKELTCVTFLTDSTVTAVSIEQENSVVTTENCQYTAAYVVGCDGANSITRQAMDIPFEELAPKRGVINVLFEAPDLANKITVEKGFLFYFLQPTPGAIGPVDLTRGLWYAQITNLTGSNDISTIDIDSILETMAGFSFQKKIVNAHLWDMQIKIAPQFSKENRVFLIGDSAHAFAPTGGFGLNTGFGDVVNLGWKLAAVIQKKSSADLLKTMEQERRPVCLANLEAAEKNAHAMHDVREKFSPEKDPEGFATASADNAKRHAFSAGLMMGYAYFDSPLTKLVANQPTTSMPAEKYTPTTKPGYFLPYVKINEKSIYDVLSKTHFTFIVCGKEKIKLNLPQLKIIHVPENTYPFRYILVRPDWHIACVSNVLILENVKACVTTF